MSIYKRVRAEEEGADEHVAGQSCSLPPSRKSTVAVSERPALRCYAVNKSGCTNAVKLFFFAVPLKCSKWEARWVGQTRRLRLRLPYKTQSDREEKFEVSALRSRLTARSTAEATTATPEVTTAASTSTELASTARTAATTAPVSSTSLTLVLSSTSTAATVVLNLREAIVSRSRGCSCRFGCVVSPALGAGDGSGLVRCLGLGRVARDDLEGLAQGLVLATSLLVPLCGSGSIGCLGLSASCCRTSRVLSLRSTNSR